MKEIKKKKCPYCGRWILSNYQQSVLDYLFKKGSEGCKVNPLANKFNTSMQSMNNTLTALINIKLIYRREVIQKSGGVEYIYWAVK